MEYPPGYFPTPAHFTGHLWVLSSAARFARLWPERRQAPACCFIDTRVLTKPQRRDLRGGADATTDTRGSGAVASKEETEEATGCLNVR